MYNNYTYRESYCYGSLATDDLIYKRVTLYQNLSLLTLKNPAITFPPVFLIPSIRKDQEEPNAPT